MAEDNQPPMRRQTARKSTTPRPTIENEYLRLLRNYHLLRSRNEMLERNLTIFMDRNHELQERIHELNMEIISLKRKLESSDQENSD